ncbi:FMN-dependent NADH-azoreductase [Nonomuraea aurantiaca]|uniref:FMN-dependent NADH-azoreductase n=1 Tax=Nonomuraea aurantiaca TaxID=2878562 RepID=UPI001CD9E947|nr:NAD(P)H-dependent oxidoreductase [Nonomuraea aurantiaca]MCA2226366.1 NAD(P)H-dependent oxidoreductase [Nonomuraea aurantiaca]
MSRLLHISASPRGAHSESLALAATFLDAYRAAHPDDVVDTFDLWDGTLPEFGPVAADAKMAALAGLELSAEQAAVWNGALAVVERFKSYDNYLFSVPMWNHGVPYVLKHFIDVVSQNGMLFAIDPSVGYTGLLSGRRAAVIYTSAVYDHGVEPEFGRDFQESFFDYWLRYSAGITDIVTVPLRQNLFSDTADNDRAAAHALARDAGKSF